MVDAVSAVNAAINTIVQQRKDVSINWKDLSAKEVLDHAGKGEDVPLEVLKWAEDYAKLENVPEDVSYDSVNGERQRDEVIEKAADSNSVESEDIKAEAEENSDEVQETEEDKTEPENKEDPNSPEVLYNQGASLLVESTGNISDSEESVRNSEEQVNQSEKRAEESKNLAKSTTRRVSSQKKEYDNLVNKITSDKSSIQISDLNKLDNLSKNLNRNGNIAQNKLAVYDAQLEEIDAAFAQYKDISQSTADTGTETVNIGNKLVDLVPPEERNDNTALMQVSEDGTTVVQDSDYRHSEWGFLYNKYYAMGKSDILTGSNAQSTGENAERTIEANKEANSEHQSEISKAKAQVEGSTMVDGKEINIGGNKENEKQVDAKVKEERLNKLASKNKTDLNGVKDSTLLSDNLELQRRREMRGEQPPQA